MTMVQFRYKAIGPGGEVNQGVMEAASRAEVIARLQSMNHVPIRADRVGDFRIASLLGEKRMLSARAASLFLVGLFRQLETLLRAGMPLDRALELLRGQSASKLEAAALGTLIERVRGGDSLSDAMASNRLFPTFCIGMVRAGEAGGSLAVSVGEIATQLEKNTKAQERLQSALLYPAIVTIACGLSFLFLFTFVVPRFRPLFEDAAASLPFVTRVVLATGDFFETHGWAAALGSTAAGLIAVRYFRVPRHRQRWASRILLLPVLRGLVLKAETGRFCRVLGSLLRNGVTLTKGLEIAVQSFRYGVLAEAVRGAIREVREGHRLADALARTGVFPQFALRLLRVGEEAARLDAMLLEIADAYDRETERDVDRLLALLGPALTIVLGLMVALVIGSILVALLGVYQLTL